MEHRSITLATITLLVIMIMSFSVSVPNGQAGSSNAALQAFESLHKAEASGADIRNLVDQYNQPNASYTTINDLASQAQQSAINAKNTYTTAVIVLIPIIALFLSLVVIGILSIIRRFEAEKLMDMRVGKRKDV